MLECAGRRILIDCGLIQGSRDPDQENAAEFGFDPRSVDTLLLTHAHLDHCGRLPPLVKRGFHGEIVTTAASRDLARLVILDAAHLQEEDAKRRQRRARRRGRESGIEPLYSLLDALDSLGRFGRVVEYGEPIEFAPGLRTRFYNAGHILGSASILVEMEETGKRRRVLFSGDLGNAGRPLPPPPSPPPPPRSL
jgi:metallo-beta-lactamase family protein